jgi:hypothetical protein
LETYTQVTGIIFTILPHLDLFETPYIRSKVIVKYIQFGPFERYSLAEIIRKPAKWFVAVASHSAPTRMFARIALLLLLYGFEVFVIV